jgi:hypothetical protein
MDLSLGGERNISQNEDHGEEMDEMEGMYIFKPMKILIRFLNTGIKKCSERRIEKGEELSLCMEQTLQSSF